MWIPHHLHGISRFHFVSRWSYDGFHKNPGYSGLAWTPQSLGHPVLPGFHQLLPVIHLQLLQHCHSINPPYLWHFSDDCQNAFSAIKKAFICTLVITHWVLDTQITVETDTSDYAVAVILSITLSNREIHPVTFHSQTLTTSKLNYDTHNKELPAIYESFQTWQHYLEGSTTLIDIITDHNNLEYISTTKFFSRRQAHWLELLSQFNLVICFYPGKLGAKPDALTRWWDVYQKRGG